jgi:hypothetical protein
MKLQQTKLYIVTKRGSNTIEVLAGPFSNQVYAIAYQLETSEDVNHAVTTRRKKGYGDSFVMSGKTLVDLRERREILIDTFLVEKPGAFA